MDPIVVVGSGASGVHFALTALRKGRRVTMLDVGHTGQEPVLPAETLTGLKRKLPDPALYFLGPRYDSLVLPGSDGEYYAFPPAKEHVFRSQPGFEFQRDGFSPLYSFAAGGLAEVWTGGCYPFDSGDLRNFPFGYDDLGLYYGRVAAEIGVVGAKDDLAAVFPYHDGLLEPLKLDAHSAMLLDSYQRRRRRLQEQFHCLMGRARLAVLSRDLGSRKACDYSGRCLWGCPSQAFYTPSITLAECRKFPGFTYCPGLYVDHFRMDASARISGVVASTRDGAAHEFAAGSLVLAAGTLSSARIFLESLYRDSGKAPELRGLMDNRQVLMPFVNLRMIGQPWSPETYQYHQVAMAVRMDSGEMIHGLVTTLKTALIHPLVQTLPFDLGTGVSAFRSVHGALGMVNINLPDRRREENFIALDTASNPHRLVVHYRPENGEAERLRRIIGTFRKILMQLKCFAPPKTIHVRPMGASVHYAGTRPMTSRSAQGTCTPDGASRDVENLYFADGSTFPDLPAKNLTFTLMANATRIAEQAF
ncbi:MAG TPA: GMC oxidoreductase [Bryobacteraceae bacterium]|nr:GMC oxidoreductase [Bryobacteraceae bacterium]